MTTTRRVDRAALVRRALVELVAEHGFRGTSMAAVAERAGVATGTAYVHYRGKDELVLAAYAELKAELGDAAIAAMDDAADPAARFRSMWFGIRDHLLADPVRARFLIQVDASPFAGTAHAAAMAGGEAGLMQALGEDLLDLLVDLPPLIAYDLAIGPIVRRIASGDELPSDAWDRLALACWRAVTR